MYSASQFVFSSRASRTVSITNCGVAESGTYFFIFRTTMSGWFVFRKSSNCFTLGEFRADRLGIRADRRTQFIASAHGSPSHSSPKMAAISAAVGVRLSSFFLLASSENDSTVSLIPEQGFKSVGEHATGLFPIFSLSFRTVGFFLLFGKEADADILRFLSPAPFGTAWPLSLGLLSFSLSASTRRFFGGGALAIAGCSEAAARLLEEKRTSPNFA
mmetsp:Transcript_7634/g.15694  ORF Transcript_7634/g.15694 Transcript_7634/m.15694 type:complete len:216 (-) Transcript_7634:3037-3684(-)